MIDSLETAIKHCEEVAEYMENKEGYAFTDITYAEYASEQRQFAEWLKELKAYREAKERIKRGLQSCFNCVHCESNHDILEGQEMAFKYCIEQLEVNADDD